MGSSWLFSNEDCILFSSITFPPPPTMLFLFSNVFFSPCVKTSNFHYLVRRGGVLKSFLSPWVIFPVLTFPLSALNCTRFSIHSLPFPSPDSAASFLFVEGGFCKHRYWLLAGGKPASGFLLHPHSLPPSWALWVSVEWSQLPTRALTQGRAHTDAHICSRNQTQRPV